MNSEVINYGENSQKIHQCMNNYGWFSCDVTAAMFVTQNNTFSLLWE